MNQPKPDVMVKQMQERLTVNREGLLTRSQWIDLLIEPVVIIAFVAAAALIFFSLRMAFVRSIVPLLMLIGGGALVYFVWQRAKRYQRLPINYGRYFADVQMRSWWQFWRPFTFYRANDDVVYFDRWIPPRIPLRITGEYMVYYLDTGKQRVLLSLAPVDEVERWKPTPAFHERYQRRGGRRGR
jgi:hypothetical protein